MDAVIDFIVLFVALSLLVTAGILFYWAIWGE